jgi:hypothetical protein
MVAARMRHTMFPTAVACVITNVRLAFFHRYNKDMSCFYNAWEDKPKPMTAAKRLFHFLRQLFIGELYGPQLPVNNMSPGFM